MLGFFKKHFPIEILYTFLDKFCIKKGNYVMFDYNSFRIMLYHDYNDEFIELLKEYYYPSKQFYLTRPLTFNSFVTIIRQLCKINNVDFESKILYQHSIYNIEYYIRS